jgi:hypothetical protein
MVGRVGRASMDVGLLEVRLLALAPVQTKVGNPTIYH